jgi:hypothetical protein
VDEIGGAVELERAREIADAALRLDPGLAALSLAADVAISDNDFATAGAYAARALELREHPELRMRLAMGKNAQLRIAEAVEVLDPVLVDNPTHVETQDVRAQALEVVAALDEDPPDDCPCRSGRPFAACCGPVGRRVLQRFRDRRPLQELRDHVYRRAASEPRLRAALDEVLDQWTRSGVLPDGGIDWERPLSGANSDEERRLWALLVEQAWMMPTVDEKESVLEFLSASPTTPPDAVRRARDWMSTVGWGLWLTTRRAGSPGMELVDYLTGVGLYVDIPPELEGLPRWSVLFGTVGAVDGVCRCGAALPMSLWEGHLVTAGFVLMGADIAARQGGPGKRTARWLRGVSKQSGPIRMPDLVDPPPDFVPSEVAALLGALAPHVVGLHQGVQREFPDLFDTQPAFREVVGPLVPGAVEDGTVDEWFESWPDRGLEIFDGLTPREVSGDEGLSALVETFTRLIEHYADRRGVELDTADLRRKLGLASDDDTFDVEVDDEWDLQDWGRDIPF